MFFINSKKIKTLNEIIKEKNVNIYYLNSVIDKYFIELNDTRHELFELKRKYNELREKHEKLCFNLKKEEK